MSHDTANHPAHQRHAAFTPPSFALLSGTAPRKRTFHQGCANPNGTATSRTSCRHTVCPHMRAFRTDVLLRGCKTSVSYGSSSKSHASSLHNERFVRDFLQKSHVKSPKRAFRTRLPPKVTRQVSKTSVSNETSSKTHTSKSAKRACRTRLPPKVKRKHPSEHTHHAALPSPSKQHPLTGQSQWDSDIHLYHNSRLESRVFGVGCGRAIGVCVSGVASKRSFRDKSQLKW